MRFILTLALAFSLLGCGQRDPNTIVVGTIAGPETELVETAAIEAKKKYGLTVKIIEFSDYNLPNEALHDGSLDVNIFQHQPYLDAANKAHGYQLSSIGKTFVYPNGIYSKKHQRLKDFPKKAVIAVPNDPSNELRALYLLEQAGLIRLKASTTASPSDISDNPNQFVIKEIDAAQLPRVLGDVDAAVINTTFALPAGLSPSRDAIYIEPANSPYANIIVARQSDTDKTQLKQFVEAMHSPPVLQKAQKLFGNDAIPAWVKKPH